MLTTIARYTAFLVRSLMCLELKIAFRSAPNAPAAAYANPKVRTLNHAIFFGCAASSAAIPHPA